MQHKTLSLTAAIAIATAMAAMALPAHAQAPAPTKKDLAQRVITAQQSSIEAMGRQLAANTSQQVLETAGAALEQVPKAKQEATGKAIQDDVKKFYDEIEPLLKATAVKSAPTSLAPLLEEKFSEDELKQVATWLESPAAKKYQSMAGDMQTALTQKLVADSRESVESKLKALEGTIRGRLEGAGAGSQAPAGQAPASKAAPKKKQ
jgi:uncharacterized protein